MQNGLFLILLYFDKSPIITPILVNTPILVEICVLNILINLEEIWQENLLISTFCWFLPTFKSRVPSYLKQLISKLLQTVTAAIKSEGDCFLARKQQQT